jgi:hypothetical protein
MAAIVLMVAAEVAATLSASVAHHRRVTRRVALGVSVTAAPYGGEPHLSKDAHTPLGARGAAVTFVRDYALWSHGQLAVIPNAEATRRVVRLLKQNGQQSWIQTIPAKDSVRIVTAGANRYLVTSAVGNFLVGQRESHWLVISLPGY